MKRTLLLFVFIPLLGMSQTKTTVANGDFYNPLIWDCTCLPASGDSLIINHAITMNTDIYYTAGRITINMNGSLIEDATDRAFWADGTGSIVNMGTFTTHLFLMSPSAQGSNMGTFANVDSVWNQGYFMNMGDFQTYDFLNDETATFHNHASLTVANNMNNQGLFHMNNTGETEVVNDFSNCNTQSLNATCENHGVMCIGNDFSNCTGDTVSGSGNYYVANQSANLGDFIGTFTFHTPSGALDVNTGTVASGVTITQGACNLGLNAEQAEPFRIYPNPTKGDLSLTVNGVMYTMFDCTGKIVKKGVVTNNQIEMDDLHTGLYLLNVDGYGTSRIIKR